MSNTLVIGYGTSSGNLARLYSNGMFPILLVDKKPIENESPHESHVVFGEDAECGLKEICRIMSDYTHVVLVSSLASTSFQEVYETISKCANDAKTVLILFCTLPFVFESERRNRAVETIGSLGSYRRTVFVFDNQKAVNGDFMPENYDSFLEMTNSCAARILGVVVRLLDSSPFFSYCSDPAYTMAVGRGKRLSDSVADALSHPFYEIATGCGKILIFSDMDHDERELEQTVNQLSAKGNAMPEFAGRSGLGVENTLLFIPISFHQHG